MFKKWHVRDVIPKRIVLRVTLILSSLIVMTLLMFALATIPFQREAILKAMESEARSTVTSIGQVTASAIISEDFGTVVDHCMRVVNESPSISYVVVTRNDGFSLVMTKTGWTQTTLGGVWRQTGARVASSRILKSDMSPTDVYHYSHPFAYSSIEWGWIHIGLSLDTYHSNVKALYFRTFLLAILCLAVSGTVAYLFARKLTEPISILASKTDLVTRGDLSARTFIKTGDELQLLGEAFNAMTGRLQQTQVELIAEKENAEAANIAKSDFLANMSHELRTPLNAVIGFSEVLQDQIIGPVNEKQQEYVTNILASGRHLLSLINDILDLSKVESGTLVLDLSVFSLFETINSSLIMLREKALKMGVTLRMDPAPSADITIVADQRKLKQILFNLLSNAVKFTPAGGTVRITAQKNNELIEISVEDTGIGIREEDIPKLFTAFTQLESVYTREYEGTGLGLALTRQLVEMHGGKIRVESRFGTGSSFIFTIPITQLRPKELCQPPSIKGDTHNVA